jgi:hypothetical protein
VFGAHRSSLIHVAAVVAVEIDDQGASLSDASILRRAGIDPYSYVG